MARVQCSLCRATWEQPRIVMSPHLYERHRPGCPAAPRPEDAEPTGWSGEPPDPYHTTGGTP